MLANVMLCISFIIGAVIMYYSMKKLLDILTEGFCGAEASYIVKETREPVTQSRDLAQTDVKPVPGFVPAFQKPRISLRRFPLANARSKGSDSVLIGTAKPYRVSIRRE